MNLYKSVDKNIEYIKNINHESCDIVSRVINNNGNKVGYVYLESVTSDDKVSEFLNKSIIGKNIDEFISSIENNIYNSHISSIIRLNNSTLFNNIINFRKFFNYIRNRKILFIH